MKHIGIDGCRAGWFLLGLDEDGEASFHLLEKISGIAKYLDTAECVLIDIPIGLRGKHPDERLCDSQARTALRPKRGSSVFPVPSRHVLACDDYRDANKLNRVYTGRGLSKQTFNIMPKIREVDDFLQQESRNVIIREMHPEVCFWALNDQKPLQFNKKSLEGYGERIEVLRQHISASKNIVESALQQYSRAELVRDDIVDALVGSVTARASAALSRFPREPEYDDTGLPMEIVYWAPT